MEKRHRKNRPSFKRREHAGRDDCGYTRHTITDKVRKGEKTGAKRRRQCKQNINYEI